MVKVTLELTGFGITGRHSRAIHKSFLGDSSVFLFFRYFIRFQSELRKRTFFDYFRSNSSQKSACSGQGVSQMTKIILETCSRGKSHPRINRVWHYNSSFKSNR